LSSLVVALYPSLRLGTQRPLTTNSIGSAARVESFVGGVERVSSSNISSSEGESGQFSLREDLSRRGVLPGPEDSGGL
jgi:hypothetical protein